MRKLYIISGVVILAAALIVTAAFAQQGERQRMFKIVIGAIDSIDSENGTLVVKAEKYLMRGEGEVDAKGEKLELTVGERARFGLEGEKAEFGDFKEGMEVVVITFEKDGKLFVVGLSDPETAKMMREKIQGMLQGMGRGGRGGEGMGPGGQGGRGGKGMRGRGKGLPIYGEVVKRDGDIVTVKPQEFPIDQLDLPEGKGDQHKGGEFAAKLNEKFPDGIRIELTDDTKVILNGEPSDLSAIKVGDKLVFRCKAPEGEWSKENLPDHFIAKVVVDIATMKQHMKDGPMGRGGGMMGA